MRIDQLLESKSSIAFNQLKNLGVNSDFLEHYFKKVLPKNWSLQNKSYKFDHVFPYLISSDLLVPPNAIFLYNVNTRKYMVFCVRTVPEQSRFTVYFLEMGDPHAVSSQISGINMESLERRITNSLRAAPNHEILMWVSDQHLNSFWDKPMGIKHKIRNNVTMLIEKFHTHLWTSIRRKLRNEFPLKYSRKFVQSLNSINLKNSADFDDVFVASWLNTTSELATHVVNKKIPLITSIDRKKVLDMFISDYITYVKKSIHPGDF